MKTVNELWQQSQNDAEGMRLGYTTQQHYFAALVRADEREACAEVCKKHADVYAGLEQNSTTQSAWAACIDLQDAIRARGQA